GRAEGAVGRARALGGRRRRGRSARGGARVGVRARARPRRSAHPRARGGDAVKRPLFFALLALACVIFAARPAHAHKPSDSYLTLAVSGAAIDGRWDIALRDLDYAMGLDADGNGAITWAELRAR